MAVLLRAIVMLVVLVGLPAAWVYYGPLPSRAQDVIDRVVDVAKSTIGWEQTEVAETDSVVAPYFDPTVIPAAVSEPIRAVQPEVELATNATFAAAPLPAPVTSSLEVQVAPLLQQLRDQGASEYTLEKWGNDGKHYRFCCDMSLAMNNQATQQFEAIRTEPGEAIQQVLAEVTNWKIARLNRTQFK